MILKYNTSKTDDSFLASVLSKADVVQAPLIAAAHQPEQKAAKLYFDAMETDFISTCSSVSL
jgi:hypothetical protein